MTIVLLIRHAENDMLEKRLAGRLPGVHLNEKGRQQAETLANALAEAPIKGIYSSPLERAVETAAPLAEKLKLPVQIRQGLIEVDFGSWEGKPMNYLRSLKQWKEVREAPATHSFPGGESIAKIQKRASEELTDIISGYDDADYIACFSHSDTIRLLIAHYLNMPLNDFRRLNIDTASITILLLGKGRPRLLNYNQVIPFKLPIVC